MDEATARRLDAFMNNMNRLSRRISAVENVTKAVLGNLIREHPNCQAIVTSARLKAQLGLDPDIKSFEDLNWYTKQLLDGIQDRGILGPDPAND